MKAKVGASAVGRWRGKRVMVLGDIMLDRFIYGRVERISPEAPVPVLHFQSEELMLGGAANVVRNVLALDGEAILVGVIGLDEDGDIIAGALSEKERAEMLLLRIPSCSTTSKTRYVSGGQQIMRLDVERPHRLSEKDQDEICEHVTKNIDRIDVLVLSDYAKGILSPTLISRVMQIAKSNKLTVVVDPKTRNVRRYQGASVITPNAVEASEITGLDCSDDEAAAEAAVAIREIAGVDSVVLTRGAQGMIVYDPASVESKPISIPTVASDIFDVSGAGDTVVAALSLALSIGLDLTASARIANVAASIAVGKQGTAVVRPQELALALKREEGRLDVKIVETEDACQMAREWKDRDKAIGFANGCFDLLHPGHIELLQRARSSCDKLIVALNSDASVNRLKGAGRPIQHEFARALVIASLDCVDLVTFFDEDTPIALIERLRPEVLIKGADYAMSAVIGADFVQSYGGRVLLVPISDGYSTTALVARSTQDWKEQEKFID